MPMTGRAIRLNLTPGADGPHVASLSLGRAKRGLLISGQAMNRILQPSVLAVVLGILTWGCDRKATAPPAPPPTAVTVAHPLVQEIIDFDDYTGRLAAVEQVEVRARVGGYLESVHYKEGAIVKKGDL